MRILLLLPLTLSGCDRIDDYFSNVVAEGLFVGVEDPGDLPDEVDLNSAATAEAWIARATSLTDIERNLVDDADRVAMTHDGTNHDFTNEDDGLYSITSGVDSELEYRVGDRYRLRVWDNEKVYVAQLEAPPAPDLDGAPAEDEFHPAGQGITIDLGGQGYNNALYLVFDQDGNLVADNRPEGVSDYLDWIGGSGTVDEVTIPGSAFSNAGAAYVLGVAGIIRAEDADFENFNPLLSNFAMGSLAVAPVITAP